MKLAAGSATDTGPGPRRTTRTPSSSTTRTSSSRSPTAWAAIAAARSRATPRSRRCAASIASGAADQRRDRACQRRQCIDARGGRRRAHGHGHDDDRRRARRRSASCSIGHVGDSRAYLLHDGDLAADHRRPQPRRGARARGPAHARAGRVAPAARDRHARARRRHRRRGRPVHASKSTPGDRRRRSAPTASPPWCASATSSASSAASPTRNARPSCSSPPPTRRAARTTSTVVVIDVLEVDAIEVVLPSTPRSTRASGDRDRRPDAGAEHRPPMRPAPEPPAPDASTPAASRGRGSWLARAVRAADPRTRHRGRRRRLVRAPARTTSGSRGNRGRDLQGRARRRARLGSHPRPTHAARRRPAHADRSRACRGGQRRAARSSTRARRSSPTCSPCARDLDHDDDHHHEAARRRTTRPRAAPTTTPWTMALAARRAAPAGVPSCRSDCSWSIVDGRRLRARRARRRTRSSRPTSTRCSRGCSVSTSSRTSRSAGSRPCADATLLPLAALLNGIGFVTHRPSRSRTWRALQSLWVAIGIAVFVLTLVRRPRRARSSSATATPSLLLGRRVPAAPAGARHRAHRQRAPALGGVRVRSQLRTERDRQGAARRVLRGVSRRQA